MNKICKKCEIEKDIIDFNTNHAICKKCYNEKRKVQFKKEKTFNKKEYQKKYYRNYWLEYRKFNIKKGKNTKNKNIDKKVNKIKYKMSGYIYIIINPAWTNYIKLGRTKNLNKRLNDYQISSPLRDYQMYYSSYTNDLSNIENYFRTNIEGNFEWFKIDKDEAKDIIIKLISEEVSLT